MRLRREQAGVIAPVPVWVLIDRPYLYIHESLIGLALQVLLEWRHDQHLVG